jgi:hypothetical protein
MGDEVEDRLVRAYDEANGQWELRGLMKCEELGDMGHFVPMRSEIYYEQGLHFLKITYHYKAILKLQS